MKFKIGDKIKYVCFHGATIKGIITGFIDNDLSGKMVIDNKFCADQDECELVEDEPKEVKPKFKVGDHVVINKPVTGLSIIDVYTIIGCNKLELCFTYDISHCGNMFYGIKEEDLKLFSPLTKEQEHELAERSKFTNSPIMNEKYHAKMKAEILNKDDSLTETQQQIIQVCDELKRFLLYKNKNYKNSALSPLNICSKNSAEQNIDSRIDEKLSRIQYSTEQGKHRKNDFVDLGGYTILKCIKEGWTDFSDLMD